MQDSFFNNWTIGGKIYQELRQLWSIRNEFIAIHTESKISKIVCSKCGEMRNKNTNANIHGKNIHVLVSGTKIKIKIITS